MRAGTFAPFAAIKSLFVFMVAQPMRRVAPQRRHLAGIFEGGKEPAGRWSYWPRGDSWPSSDSGTMHFFQAEGPKMIFGESSERKKLEQQILTEGRVPPEQSPTLKWPVLHHRRVPRVDL